MDWGHTTRARPVVTEQNISKKASACARLCCWHWQHKNLLFWHLASPSSSSSSPIPYAIALLFTFLSCDCAVAHGPHAWQWHSSSPYAVGRATDAGVVWWPGKDSDSGGRMHAWTIDGSLAVALAPAVCSAGPPTLTSIRRIARSRLYVIP